jgi:hypothetical protein
MIWIVRLLPDADDLAPVFEGLACFGALTVLVFLGADIGSSTGAAAAVRFWFRLRFAIMFVGLVMVLCCVVDLLELIGKVSGGKMLRKFKVS